MHRFISILLFLSISFSAQAKNITVAILGNMPTNWEHEDFGQTSLYLTRAAQKRGEQVILGSPFKFRFINGRSPGLSHFNVQDDDDIKALMKKVNSLVGPGDTVNLLVYGHGMPTRNETNPDKTILQLGKDRINHQKLSKIINKNLSKEVGLKVIAPYCFSGSIHRISQKRKNSCSVAASDFRTPSKGESSCFFGPCQAIRSYGMDIGKKIYENPNMSLAQAHEQVSEKDYMNERRGKLSSIDYLQRIFKTGPYKIRKNWFQRVFSDHPDKTVGKNFIKKNCSDVKHIIELEMDELEKLSDNVTKIVEHINLSDEFSEEVPTFVRERYEVNLDRYKKELPKLIDDLNSTYNAAKGINEQVRLAKENGQLMDWSEQQMAMEVKDEARHKANEFLRYHHYDEEITLINRLYAKGNKKQIAKFEGMVQCEND